MKVQATYNKAPIAFFAYKRPEHTRSALESLSRNHGAEQSELFVFCDGPRSPEDEEDVNKVRALVKSHLWCRSVRVIERDKNQGLASSIINGVSEIINQYGRAIIVEDDLIPSPHFLNYMNDALEIYQDIPKVMHIAGYMFPVQGHLPDTFFYRVPSCWGWGTWKRAWAHFEEDAVKLLHAIKNTHREHEFNIEGSMNYLDMLQQQAEGILDSWAIRWYASTFIKQGMCLHPGRSLVNNIGHDGSGRHCTITDGYTTTVSQLPVRNFTEEIAENRYAVEQIIRYYAGMRV